jgi:hypothetical protein
VLTAVLAAVLAARYYKPYLSVPSSNVF